MATKIIAIVMKPNMELHTAMITRMDTGMHMDTGTSIPTVSAARAPAEG